MVTKATHMYQNHQGVESRPEINKMRRAPTPPKQILIADLISMLDWLVT